LITIDDEENEAEGAIEKQLEKGPQARRTGRSFSLKRTAKTRSD